MAGFKMIRAVAWMAIVVWCLHLTSGITFWNNPITVTVNENSDAADDIWPLINVTCDVDNGTGVIIAMNCTTCNMSAGNTNLFELLVGFTLSKRECLDPECGICPSCTPDQCSEANGCLNHSATPSYDVEITCWMELDNLTDNDAGSANVTVIVEQAVQLAYNNLPRNITANNSIADGTVIFQATTDHVRDWELGAGMAPSWNLNTPDLFLFDNATGEVKVNAYLAEEYTYSGYVINICAWNRRYGPVCENITINLEGCFQEPTCTAQHADIQDTTVTGTPLFTMVVPGASDHFEGQGWAGLGFTIVSTTLDVAINSSGVLSTTGNITVYPNLPPEHHIAVIEVSNNESCNRTSQCTVTFNVTFTNWPISITNTLAELAVNISEDTDAVTTLLSIVTYDGNDPTHDNVSCAIDAGANSNTSLFEMVSDGNTNYNSWSIRKIACGSTGCGFRCPLDIGCMNYHVTPTYSIPFTCVDDYGSNDSTTLNVTVLENIPQVNNLDATANATNDMSNGTVIYNLTSTDDVTWFMNATVNDSFLLETPGLFTLDAAQVIVAGNLTNEYSNTYYMTICSHDRRNEVCGVLTIILEGCFQEPTCNDQHADILDTTVTGTTLFTMDVPGASDHFEGQGWAGLGFTIVSTTPDVDAFDVIAINSSGVLSTTGNITVYPNLPHDHHIAVIEVSNNESCSRTSQCTVTFNVTFTNWPISIRNTPAELAVDIYEDTDNVTTLLSIVTYDGNDPAHDNVNCAIDANSNTSLFEMVSDSNTNYNSWSIQKIACGSIGCGFRCPLGQGCLNYHVTSNYSIPFTCVDDHGSSNSTTLEVTVLENIPQVINLNATANAHRGMSVGTAIYDLNSTDDVTWFMNATVDDSFLLDTPGLFTLNATAAQVEVAAVLSDEYSYTYYMTICSHDRRNEVCGVLTIILDACFETPTCDNQTKIGIFIDTHAIGDPLFDMERPDPTGHFAVLNATWQGLSYRIINTTLVVARINDTEIGQIDTSGNITVHPHYPVIYHVIVVEVSNSASCNYVTTCTMDFDVAFTNWPLTITSLDEIVYIDEDYDLAINLHPIVTFDYNNPDHDNVTCFNTSNPDPSLFEIQHDGFQHDSWSIWKKECNETGCGFVCDPDIGCMNHDSVDKYVINITCVDAYGSSDTGQLTVNVVENPQPTISVPDSTTANKTDHGLAAVIYTTTTNEPENVTWRLKYIEDSWLLNTSDVFLLREGKHSTADVYVNKPLDNEYSYNYTMTICGQDRRTEVCGDLLIQLSACFQRPTCQDQNISGVYNDTFNGTLFKMIVPDPSFHFVHISTGWQLLSFDRIYSSLDVALLDTASGDIFNTDNITVWPNYTHSYHSMVVEINNSESCSYNYRCILSYDVEFVNWDISITNLPNTTEINEDDDEAQLMFNIVAYDYNNIEHDNVTCYISNPNDTDTSLWVMYHDGGSGHRSWSINKTRCRDPECGFICALGRGCMNYNLNSTYYIEITCHDAYTSSYTDILTINLIKNEVFTFTNLPRTILLDSDKVTEHDTLYRIMYSDNENEILNYTVTILPTEPDPYLLFGWDTRGNYSNNLANITALNELWNLEPIIYDLYICGKERRNMNCTTLTINITDYCSAIPACVSDTNEVSDGFTKDGVLFNINGTGPGELTYYIITSNPQLFKVDSSGVIKSNDFLPASYPYTRYSINGVVTSSTACETVTCTYDLTVMFTNDAIAITSLPATTYVVVSEDTTTEVILHTIVTDDDDLADAGDAVTCDVIEDPDNNGIFFTEAKATDRNVFMILSKAGNNFDYNLTQQYTVRVMCNDSYGSSAIGVLTVLIDENLPPQISNLPRVKQVSPFVIFAGDTLFTIITSDPEDDPLTISCSPVNNMNPLQCNTDSGEIILRRNVTYDLDVGTTYSRDICVKDAKHERNCSTFSIIPTINETSPSLDDNLPASVQFDENKAGTWLFNVTYNDPDVGEAHTFSMTVSPSSAAAMFEFDTATGVLALSSSSTLNYEELSVYTFTFYVSDPYVDSGGPGVLTLNVNDLPEAPVFRLRTTTVTTVEGDAELELDTIAFRCTDPDVGQRPTVSITAGPHMAYFAFDDATGMLSYADDWDIENITAGLPETTWITLTCDDDTGLSKSANVTVNVEPVNEFYPVVDGHPHVPVVDGHPHVYIDIISDNQAVHIPLYNFTATDKDVRVANVFTWDVLGIGEGKQYFTMVGGGSSAKLMLRDFITLSYNKTFRFTIYVEDEAINPFRTHVKVTANYIVYITSTPATEPTYCTTCTTPGKVVVGVLAAEGLIVVAIIIHIIVRCTTTAGSSLGQNTLTNLASVSQPAAPQTHQPSVRQDGPKHNRHQPNQHRQDQQRQDQQRRDQQRRDQQRRDDDRISMDSDESDFSDDDIQDRRRPGPRFQQRTYGGQSQALPRPVYSSQTVPSYNAGPVPSAPGANAANAVNPARAGLPNPVYASNQAGYMTFNTPWGQ